MTVVVGFWGFFLEGGDLPFDIHVDLAVFLGVFQSSHIMNAQHRCFLLLGKRRQNLEYPG